jgi:hypothetical protein
MKTLSRILMLILCVAALAAACAPAPATESPDLDAIVAQTFAALTAQAPPPSTITPTPAPGSISGTLSYPSEGIPALRVVAFNLSDRNYYSVDTQPNQSIYQITGLPPGKYHVVAYTMDGQLAGGFTPAVACGLTVTCTDHALSEVVVLAGQDVTGIDPQDWYAPPGTFPPMP